MRRCGWEVPAAHYGAPAYYYFKVGWTKIGGMDDRAPLKNQLPFPYNQDLSNVLRRLNRRTPFARKRLANDPVTAAYLAAGVRLIERHLGPGATRDLIDPEDEDSTERPLLSFLSQRLVATEVGNNPAPFHRMGSTSTLRSSWGTQSNYVSDLLRFSLWSEHYVVDYDPKVDISAEALIAGTAFAQAAHAACYGDLSALMDMPRFRLELFAAAVAEGDKVIQAALAENYEGSIAPWREVYAEVLHARGLRFRPGVDLDSFAELLAALGSGLGMRGIGDPTKVFIDHDHQRSLYGTGALALVLGCVEHVDRATGLSVEQAVDAMVNNSPRAQDTGEADGDL